MRKYYAMQWSLNGVYANTGSRCADYYWFNSRVERDQWVSEGAPYRGAGFRELVAGRDAELRQLKRRETRWNERGTWIEGLEKIDRNGKTLWFGLDENFWEN
jgi:hypothetical protein